MKKTFWILMMAGSIAGWAFTVSGLIKPYQNEKLRKIWKAIFCLWVFGHPLELAVSTGIGRKAGLTVMHSIIKTLAFGFTWWVPLKLGVIKK